MKQSSLSQGLQSIFRHPVLSLANILTLTFSLAIVALFLTVLTNVSRIGKVWQDEIQMVVFLDGAQSDNELNQWHSHIAAFPEVDGVSYVSSEEAFIRFRDQLGERSALLDGVSAQVLPATFEVQLKPDARDIEQIKQIAARIEDNLGIHDIEYGQDWLERFLSFFAMVKTAGIVGGIFLGIASLSVIANTIRLTIFSRRDELEVLSLLGADKMYIALPFIWEGVIHGLLGGIIAIIANQILFFFVVRDGLHSLLGSIGGISQLSLGFQLVIILSGLLIGGVGSLFSLRKFMR